MSRSQSALMELELPGARKRKITLDKSQVQIGREPSCDIWLPDGSVSRHHARLERPAAGNWRIVDLGSKNGTLVNGEQLELAELFDGDVIEVGRCRMTLRLHPEAEAGEAELELETVAEDALTLVVDSVNMPPEELILASILSQIHEAARRLNRSVGMEMLIDAIAREFRMILAPDRAAVGIERGSQCDWPVVIDANGDSADGSDLPHRLIHKAEVVNASIVLDWSTLWDGVKASTGQPEEAKRRCFLFPLKVGPKRLGYAYVEGKDPDYQPAWGKMQLAALLAHEAGLLLERMQLIEERKAAEKLRGELVMARRMQRALFPHNLDLDPRIDVAGLNHPYFGISGDYYDCQLVAPGKLAFIIADVMGHGLASATIMPQLHAVFRMGVREGWDLVAVDRRLDEVMEAASEDIVYATGLLGVCDLEGRLISILSAGHPWPSMLWKGQRIGRIAPACTFPWGVGDGTRNARPAELSLPDRWSLITYTDGLIEAKDSEGTPYSSDRLEQLHAQSSDLGADGLCECVLDDVLVHTGSSGPPEDDMTLLAFCRKE